MDSQNAKVIIGILSVKQKLIKSNIERNVFVFVFITTILFLVCALVPRNKCKLGKLEIRLTFIKVVRGHSFLPLTFCPSQDLYLL